MGHCCGQIGVGVLSLALLSGCTRLGFDSTTATSSAGDAANRDAVARDDARRDGGTIVDGAARDLQPHDGAADAGNDAASDRGSADVVPPPCVVPADCWDDDVCTDDLCLADGCHNPFNTVSCDDGDACTGPDFCSGGVCSGGPRDMDGDFHVDRSCGGDDCADDDPTRNPRIAEDATATGSCSDNIDNDCDTLTDAADPSCTAATPTWMVGLPRPAMIMPSKTLDQVLAVGSIRRSGAYVYWVISLDLFSTLDGSAIAAQDYESSRGSSFHSAGALLATGAGYHLIGTVQVNSNCDAWANLIDETLKVTWAHSYGPGYCVRGTRIDEAADGSLYAGLYDQGQSPIVPQTVLAKLDPASGSLTWQVDITALGNVFDVVALGNDAIVATVSTSGLALSRFDPSGSLLWTKIASPRPISGVSLETSTSGDILLMTDAVLVRLDGSGTKKWARSVASFGRPVGGRSLLGTADDGVVVVGQTAADSGGRRDGWLEKLDRDGLLIWERTLGADGQESRIGTIGQTPDGSLIASGLLGSTPVMFRVRSDGSFSGACASLGRPIRVMTTADSTVGLAAGSYVPAPASFSRGSHPASSAALGDTVSPLCP